MPATIIGFYNPLSKPHHVFAEADTVRAVADLISRHRYGCLSALLPTEKRELLLAYIGELLQELDRPEGLAS